MDSEQLKTVDYTLGGRLPPIDPDESAAPRDEDDDLLERLCTERFDLIMAGKYEESLAVGKRIGEVRVRQSERTSAALQPLYAEWPRPWDKLRPIQYAEARRIVLTYRSESVPMNLKTEAAMRRADALIDKHSK